MNVRADRLGPDRPVRRGPGSAASWFAITACALAGVSPLLLVASTPLGDRTSSVWPAALAVAIISGARYAWLLALGARRLYELIFWLFSYVFLGLAPLVQMRAGRYPETTPDIDTTLNHAAITIVLVGLLGFVAGVRFFGARSAAQADVAAPVDRRRTVALTGIALLASGYYASRVGLGPLLSSRDARTAADIAIWPNSTVLAVVKALSTLPLVIAFGALVQLIRRRRTARSGLVGLAALVLLALLLLVNPLSSPRYVSGTAALAAAVSIGATSTRLRGRLFAMTLALGLVLVFPYADMTRRSADERSTAPESGPVVQLSSADFDAFAQTNNAVAFVRDQGLRNGQQLLGAALFWVPRSVWPRKPSDTGVLLAEFRGYKVTNLSAPLPAELYVNGGLPLVLVGMAVLGAGVARLDDRSAAGVATDSASSVLAGSLPFYLVIVLRGSLLQAMAGLAVLLVSGRLIRNRGSQPRHLADYVARPHRAFIRA